uniref:von Willebrand factor D and EGF domain-containing protein-like n=1 Tax=Petromyzon marinus TaxID=7757 RepID=A0AAJ7WL65_PETMA|nr:von Willebrand factor D and EGF domain-containing protein-like [Petromyzon marinus]
MRDREVVGTVTGVAPVHGDSDSGRTLVKIPASRTISGPRGAALRTMRPAGRILHLLHLVLLLHQGLRSADAGAAAAGLALPFVYESRARCEPPCRNYGLCVRNDTCFCLHGYQGERCQHATCNPQCKHGGECLRSDKCRCTVGFEGRFCQKASCSGGCMNGGQCVTVLGVSKCSCLSGWGGARCHQAMCSQGCRNGGVCVVPDICSCLPGWHGGACQIAECQKPCLNGGKCVAPDVCRCRHYYRGPRCATRVIA